MKAFPKSLAWMLAVPAISLLVSCASRPNVVSDSALDSAADHGFLLIMADRQWTNKPEKAPPNLELIYRAREGSRLAMKQATFTDRHSLILQKLPVGRYIIYNSFAAFSHMDIPDLRVDIKPGEITYVGSFNLNAKWPTIGLLTTRQMSLSNELEKAKFQLSAQYPKIAALYPLRAQVTEFSIGD